MNAVNMDTGYVNYLSETKKVDVLRWTGSIGKRCAFVGGAYIEGQPATSLNFTGSRWTSLWAMVNSDLVPNEPTTRKSSAEKATTYEAVCGDIRMCWRSSWDRCSRRT